MNSYSFNYSLSYDEAYEAFKNISERGNAKLRKLATIGVACIAVFLLVGFALDSTKIHFIYTAFFAVTILALLVYGPVVRARKGAAKVAKINGSYQVRITDAGQVILPRMNPAPLAVDKNSRAIETENIFVIRTDSSTTICLPKRMMKNGQEDEIRQILKTYMKFENRR